MNRQQGRRWLPLSLAAALLALFAMVAVACGDDDDDDGGDQTPAATKPAGQTPSATQPSGGGDTITIKKGDKIKIGISTTLTTDNAQLGIPIRDGALLAIKQKGTIKDFEIEGIAEDDLCSGPGSVTAAQKLVSEDVVAVQGAMCSSGTVAALDTYAQENVLVISGSSTGVQVTNPPKANFLRTAWNDATQGAEMAKYACTTLGKKNAVLVNDQSVYGKGLMDVFKKAYTDGGCTVASEEAVTVGEKDFSPVVTKIKGENPEIVVFGGFIAEGAVLVRQLRDANVAADFMGADGIADAKYIEQAGGAAEGSYVSRGPTPAESTAYDKFAAEYNTEYGKAAGQFSEHAYDAMNVILAAIEASATVDADGNLVIDRQALIDAAHDVKLPDGASGPIEFNESGDRVIAAGTLNRIDQVKSGVLERIQ